LGVGPNPIPRGKLTADKLAYAIRVAASHAPMRQRAADLGAKIRAEDGVGNAAQIIHQTLDV
jgi:UDP:flavonoid glycosyltransferase YjiC (YdhE family)